MAGKVTGRAPWTSAVRWRDAARDGACQALVADADDLARMAQALDVVALKSLRATFEVQAWRDGVEIAGRVEAVASRVCGLTLDIYDEMIDEKVSIRVVPADSPHAPDPQMEDQLLDLEAEDPPDVGLGDTIDLGAYAFESLSLVLDPFPRKPGAVFSGDDQGPRLSPFAALARLKRISDE